MDAATRAWLIGELGTATDRVDLELRYDRLGTARATALEILRQRLADLISDGPTVVGVSGVVSINQTANLAALERKIAYLESDASPSAPDDPPTRGDTGRLGVMYLRERPRR